MKKKNFLIWPNLIFRKFTVHFQSKTIFQFYGKVIQTFINLILKGFLNSVNYYAKTERKSFHNKI